MLHKTLYVGLLVVLGCGSAAAEEFSARITKVAGGQVTFRKDVRGRGRGAPEEVTLPAAADVKVVPFRRNARTGALEVGGPLPGGLHHERLTQTGAAGVRARLVTDAVGRAIQEIQIYFIPDPLHDPLERPASGGAADPDSLPPHAVARLGSNRFRYGGMLVTYAVSPDGRTLAAGGNNWLQVLDAETGRTRYRAGPSFVSGLAFSPDGKRLASYGADKQVRIMAVETGQPLHAFAVEPVPRSAGLLIAYLAFLPDGKHLLLTEGRKSPVQLFDTEKGTRVRTYGDEGKPVYAVALSPDGRTLAVAQDAEAVRLWDVAAGKPRGVIQTPSRFGYALAFSPDGKILATGTSGVHLWDAATGNLLRTLAADTPRTVVRSLSFSPDGKQLVANHAAALVFWDSATGKELRWFPSRSGDVRFLPDGRTLLRKELGASTFQFLDARTGQPIRRFDGHDRPIEAVAFAPDGKSVATAQLSGRILVWDAGSGRAVWQSDRIVPGRGMGGLAFHPKSNALATCMGQNIVLWDLKTGAVRRTPMGDPMVCTALAFSVDGSRLAAAGMSGTARLLDLASGKEVRDFRIAPQQRPYAVFSPDLRRAASTSLRDFSISIWDMAMGKVLSQCQRGIPGPGPSYQLAFSPDGRTLAEAGGMPRLFLWEAATGQLRRAIRFPGGIQCIAFAPDGRRAAVAEWVRFPLGAKDAEKPLEPRFPIYLIGLPEGRTLATLLGHAGQVNALSFSPDGRRLVSASADTTALIWDIAALDTPRRAATAPLAAGQRAACWKELIGDAARAYPSMWQLADDPGAVEFLRGELKQLTTPPDTKVLGGLLAELDSKEFAVREHASKQLASLGPAAAGELRRFLAGKPSPEVRRRVEQLLLSWEGQELRGRRAVEVLEWKKDAAARQLLEALARGDADAALTQEAKAALERLAK
jgi:WD40 repeat protein